MKTVKKIINDPQNVVSELLDGVVDAYHGAVRRIDGMNALVKTIKTPAPKVGLLIGGGSGHEPLFPGFIGDNLADATACGNIFAAPSPDVILAATKAVDHGQGVLYVYGNYAGDNLNFDLAAEMAAGQGLETRTVRIWDDVASSPLEQIEERRGIAGDLFVIKIAGAATASGINLEQAYRVTSRARDNTRSMGVALGPGSIPETGEPTFELPPGEMEIGMGLHGERGVSRGPMIEADALIEQILLRITDDLPYRAGDEVCLLVNDLGSTTMMELLIANRKAHDILRKMGIRVHDTQIGSYCTCQEMAGLSISLMKLDDELKAYYGVPVRSLALTRW